MNVGKTRIDKKLDEWYQRGLELEQQGLDPGVIGSMARFERLRAENRKRFYRDLVVRVGKNKIKVAVVEQPESPGGHVTLAVLLNLPLIAKGEQKGAGKKAITKLAAFVREAVAESLKQHQGQSRKAGHGNRRVKPA
jgi:hypothetical protein